MFRAQLFVVLFLGLSALFAHAKPTTVRGVVGWGSTDSGITGLDPSCAFLTYGPDVYVKILSVCSYENECEVVADLDENGWILKLHSVRLVDINVEPSVAVITGAAYWALSVGEQVRNGSLWVEPLTILNFNSYVESGETFYECDFRLVGHEKGLQKNVEIGSGKVRMVKRGSGWWYYK